MTPCTRCGGTEDLLAAFTHYGMCGKCVREIHRKAVAQKKKAKPIYNKPK